jgi:hypothetical protein
VGGSATFSAETRWSRISSAHIASDFESEGSMRGVAFAGLLGGFRRRRRLEGRAVAASRPKILSMRITESHLTLPDWPNRVYSRSMNND